MVGEKVCNKCGKKNLGWDYDFNKKTKKWKLENHKRTDGKWCNKPPENKWSKIKKTDIYKCKLCVGNSGWLVTDEAHIKHPEWHYTSLDYHLETFHKG